ncbi:hypothetical protein GP486_000297 [Trichoglossum hirsutum]|uniref:Uncharacterized protein n=1 Tax=Trichoglossum hirsutum TaxID=265104 RepID=A0A9P8RU28_9PEZI|nr:hypothetical protein GP486_000297 [Trichoglossum hirsutum]
MQVEASIRESYILITLFIKWFLLQTPVLIFSIVYSIIHNRFTAIWRDDSLRFRVWQTAHYLFICLLAILWIADFILYLRSTLKYLGSNISTSVDGLSSAYRKFDAALQIVFFAAALDVLICATVISKEYRFRRLNSRISAYLLSIIVPSILITTLVHAIYGIYFTLLNHSSPSADLLELIFAGIPTVITLLGIVLVGLQDDWHVE